MNKNKLKHDKTIKYEKKKINIYVHVLVSIRKAVQSQEIVI